MVEFLTSAPENDGASPSVKTPLKIPELQVEDMLNFDASVKKTSARHQCKKRFRNHV